jgi:hypothetical protein
MEDPSLAVAHDLNGCVHVRRDVGGVDQRRRHHHVRYGDKWRAVDDRRSVATDHRRCDGVVVVPGVAHVSRRSNSRPRLSTCRCSVRFLMSSAAISGSTGTGRVTGDLPVGTADLRWDCPVTDALIGRLLVAP